MIETIEAYQCVSCKVFTTKPFYVGNFEHRCDKCSKIEYENSVRWKSTINMVIPNSLYAFKVTA